MAVLVLAEACIARFVEASVPDASRETERSWLALALCRSLQANPALERFLQPANEAMVRWRVSRESDAVRRAFRQGEPVQAFDYMQALAMSSTIRLVPQEDTSCLNETVDWLLSLRESNPRMLAKLERITLEQAAGHSHRWHQANERRAQREQESRARARQSHAVGGRTMVGEADPHFMGGSHPAIERLERMLMATAAGHRAHLAGDLHALHIIGQVPAGEPARADAAGRPVRVHGQGTKSVMLDCQSGRSWWRLLDRAALDAESRMMGHCVGEGGYDWKVEHGASWILSLREATGQSVCTAEWQPAFRLLNQVKGPGNQAVQPDAVSDIKELVARLQPATANQADLQRNLLRLHLTQDGIVEAADYTRAEQLEALRDLQSASRLDFWPLAEPERLGFLNYGFWGTHTQEAIEIAMATTSIRNHIQRLIPRPGIPLPGDHAAGLSQNTASMASGYPGQRDAGRRFSRHQAVKDIDWKPLGSTPPRIDELRSIAANPGISAIHRAEAVRRLKDLFSSSGPATSQRMAAPLRRAA